MTMTKMEMLLKKCCNHPYLIDGVEDQELKDKDLDEDEIINMMVKASSKLAFIDNLLPEIKQRGSKVVIYFQLVRMMDIFEDYVRHRGFSFERIDGQVPSAERQERLARFSTPSPDPFIFLATTRSSTKILNLKAADTVIFFDNDPNPENDEKALKSVYGVGQNRPVSVIRLLTRLTYETSLFERSHPMPSVPEVPQAALGNEIESLLRFGSAAVFAQQDDSINTEDPDFWTKLLPDRL
jgi:SNF2 family DNA or RNA helicase